MSASGRRPYSALHFQFMLGMTIVAAVDYTGENICVAPLRH